MTNSLLIIDPQNDFCTGMGRLYVKDSERDMDRLSKWIIKNTSNIDFIHVTLDSHQPLHIAHPVFWKDKDGKHPDPFTIISVEDVESKKWFTTPPNLDQRYGLDYVKKLKENGRYPLCIWPPHCIIGTDGHGIVLEVNKAINFWAETKREPVGYIFKGMNPFTESYSAIGADVPLMYDPSTDLNQNLIDQLEYSDNIIVAGEASSHCVASTVRDIANNFRDPNSVKKLVYLMDCASPVTGFENLETRFIEEMVERGMRISDSINFLK